MAGQSAHGRRARKRATYTGPVHPWFAVERMLMRWSILLAGVSGAVGVGMGAGAAHGLSGKLTPEALSWVRTSADYQLWHSVLLACVGMLGVRGKGFVVSAGFLAAGILIFCGSLYIMAFTGMRWLGAVTPVGGAALIAGWLALAWAGWRFRDNR